MFIEYNPNPVGATDREDCAMRALAKALNESWEAAHLSLSVMSLMMGSTTHDNNVIGAVLRQNGFRRAYPPSDCASCYTVEDFMDLNPDGTFVVFSQGHVATVKDGDLYDTTDSSPATVYFVWYKDTEPTFEKEE